MPSSRGFLGKCRKRSRAGSRRRRCSSPCRRISPRLPTILSESMAVPSSNPWCRRGSASAATDGRCGPCSGSPRCGSSSRSPSPLYTLLSRAPRRKTGASSASPTTRPTSPRRRCRVDPEQPDRGDDLDRDRHRTRLSLRLRTHPQPDARQADRQGGRAHSASGAVDAAGDLAPLPVRQSGTDELGDGLAQHLRADRHRDGRGVLLLPARAAHPDDRARHGRRPVVRGSAEPQGEPARIFFTVRCPRQIRTSSARSSSVSRK